MKVYIELEIKDNEVVSAKMVRPEKAIHPEISQYARFFDEGCPKWEKDPEYVNLFLRCQQGYANDLLKTRGLLFLNEVYDLLGIPRTKEGAVVGWVYDEKNPVGDNKVDFGLALDMNRNFINGWENRPLLDFNVDGNILDYLERETE